jgi:hypothetical protein
VFANGAVVPDSMLKQPKLDTNPNSPYFGRVVSDVVVENLAYGKNRWKFFLRATNEVNRVQTSSIEMDVGILVNCYIDTISRVPTLPVFPGVEKYYQNFTLKNNLPTLVIKQRQDEEKIT